LSHLPTVEPETQPFWDAAAEERLLIQRCDDCGRWQYYPRPFCKVCWSGNVSWAQASGRATLYTFSIVRRNDLPPFDQRVPYVAAVVDLEEGPRMVSEVVDCALDAIEIGMPLEVTYRDLTDDLKLPVFRPHSRGSGA
jgi:uncharacterized OB-fold protein